MRLRRPCATWCEQGSATRAGKPDLLLFIGLVRPWPRAVRQLHLKQNALGGHEAQVLERLAPLAHELGGRLEHIPEPDLGLIEFELRTSLARCKTHGDDAR